MTVMLPSRSCRVTRRLCVLAGHEATLQIAGQAIGLVGRLLLQGHALAGRVLHAAAVVDIAKQQIAAFLPPHGPFGWPRRAAEAISQVFDGFRSGNNRIQFTGE